MEAIIDKATVSFGEDGSVKVDHAVDNPRDAAVMKQKIVALEKFMGTMPEARFGDDACPLKHEFTPGLYIRTVYNPRGMVIVTKTHKETHPFFLMMGELSIITDKGPMRIKAPYHGITQAGTKRVIYVNEDALFITVHRTDETDLDKIEAELIIPEEILPEPIETEKLR